MCPRDPRLCNRSLPALWMGCPLVSRFSGDGVRRPPNVWLQSGVRQRPWYSDSGSSDNPVRDLFCDGTSALGQRGPLQREVTSGASAREMQGIFLWDRLGPSGGRWLHPGMLFFRITSQAKGPKINLDGHLHCGRFGRCSLCPEPLSPQPRGGELCCGLWPVAAVNLGLQ